MGCKETVERRTQKMGILDRDLAFSFDYMKRFQENAIRAIEVAEETGLKQEESIRQLRNAVDKLPAGVSTSRIRSTLDSCQGKMVPPIYQETKVYLRNRIDQLIDNITAIDKEAGDTFTELGQRSLRLAWQYQENTVNAELLSVVRMNRLIFWQIRVIM